LIITIFTQHIFHSLGNRSRQASSVFGAFRRGLYAFAFTHPLKEAKKERETTTAAIS